MSERTCATCRWWVFDPDEAEGLCQRHPERAWIVANQIVWPRRLPADWCGEHQPREVRDE